MSESHPPSAKCLVTAAIDVRWGDMDAFGHVNNSVYATYIEEARLRWFATVEAWNDARIGPVVAASTINFRVPIEWPERLDVTLTADRVGNASLTLGFRMVGTRDAGVLYADGSTVLVWIDKAAGRSIALPGGVRAAVA